MRNTAGTHPNVHDSDADGSAEGGLQPPGGWWSLMDQEEAPSRDQRTRGDSENTSSVGQPSTDGEVAPAALDRSFLDAVFGDAEGYAHFAVGRGAHAEGGKYRHKSWQPSVFLWPQQADEAMRTINAALSEPGLNDVYVCPNILKTDKRNKDTAVTHRLLHSDADLQARFLKGRRAERLCRRVR